MTNLGIEEQIAELEHMSTPDLAARFEELHGKPPRCRYRRWLQKRIAWKMQEHAYGGLSRTAIARLESIVAELDLPFGREEKIQQTRENGALSPGTTLCRRWRDQDVRVQVLDGGAFECDGVRYQSLSAVANAVTGSHVSGPSQNRPLSQIVSSGVFAQVSPISSHVSIVQATPSSQGAVPD